MKLRLIGHEYKYAVEQIMLALFPEERPEYDAETSEARKNPRQNKNDETAPQMQAESRLIMKNERFAQAITKIYCGDEVSLGIARIGKNKLTDEMITDRLLRKIVKQSFYRAATRLLKNPPEWGSLTGIRPAKVAAAAIESGMSEAAAKKMLTREYYVSGERAAICVESARAAILEKSKLKPGDIALYVGIPFCPTRCAYCSFVSNSVEKSFGLVEPFVETLLAEISEMAKMVAEIGLRVDSVYIGGGTPTSLPANELNRLMRALGDSFDFSNLREYTVEAGRPDTITEEKIEIIKDAGARRICINPQSMSADVLKAIGRSHEPEDILTAANLIKKHGLSMNMDIIAGLPQDNPKNFSDTLDKILELKPENITVHTLSQKKGSRIMLEETMIPSGDDVAKMLKCASFRLRKSGFAPYYLYRQKFTSGGFENIGWSLPGYQGIYNICMMEELCTVIALGGGGVTKLVSPNGRIERIFNAKYPREYILQADKISSKIEATADFIRENC